MRKERLVRYVVVGVFVLIGLGLFGTARKWIGRSGNSSGTGKVTVRETEEVRKDMVFIEDDNDDNFQYVENVYDLEDDGLEEKKKEFLGENYEEYKPVLDKIRLECSAVMRSIPEGREGYNPMESKPIGKAHTSSCMLREGLEGYDSFFITEALTVVDLFDETCVIYAYDYPNNAEKELVVVDYKNIEANTDYTKVMDIGDVRSMSGYRENSIIRKVEGFYVLYLKG